jgi:RNA polymerase sigma-70 factor, ECF subfamily
VTFLVVRPTPRGVYSYRHRRAGELPPAELRLAGVAEGSGVRPGDDFQQFYQASYGPTVAMVAAVTGSRHEAEDVTQEAFARALIRWPKVRDYDRPEAWIRRVALHIAIDSSRRARRRIAASARVAAQRELPGPEPGDNIQYTALGAALMELPIRERQVLVLHYLADLSIEAIAAECGLPAGTVKTRLATGRRHLEQRLSQQPEVLA